MQYNLHAAICKLSSETDFTKNTDQSFGSKNAAICGTSPGSKKSITKNLPPGNGMHPNIVPPSK